MSAGSARDLLRWQFRRAHALLESVAEPLTVATAHRHRSGAAAAAGARFAQTVLCEDLSVASMLAAGTPLALSTWAGRTGLSELPPLLGSPEWQSWAYRVRIDPAALRPYAAAVYAATDCYLAGLRDDAIVPASGEQAECLLSALLLTLAMRRGEITCLLAIERVSRADEQER